MKIIVLGASGQIGSLLYHHLRKRHEVIGTSRKPGQGYLQFDPFRDDWAVLGKADVLINCIGQIQPEKESTFQRIHLGISRLIIQNRKAVGDPVIIQISALGASADHAVEFLKTKGMADDFLLRCPDTVVVRPSIVCTSGTMVVRKMQMLGRFSQYINGIVPVPKGFLSTRIQPVMPEDLASVVEAITTGSVSQRVIDVVGPEAITFHRILVTMFKARHRTFRPIEIPRTITDFLVRYVVRVFCPGIITLQQYQLLFDDNIADPEPARKILRGELESPVPFFLNQLSHASH